MRCFSLIVTLRLRLFRYPAPRAPHFSAQTLIVRDALRTSRRVRLQVLAQRRRAGARPTLAPFKPSGSGTCRWSFAPFAALPCAEGR
jgi:hypothetical protein